MNGAELGGLRLPAVDPANPVFAGLPRGGRTPVCYLLRVRRLEDAGLALGYLCGNPSWRLHRVGRAAYAHGANGLRLVVGVSLGDELPGWWQRLLSRGAVVIDLPPGHR